MNNWCLSVFVLLLFISGTSSFFAQNTFSTLQEENVEFTKESFGKERKAELKLALDELEQGDKLFKLGIGHYKEALLHYLSAEKINPNNALLNYKIGKCYLLGHIYKIKSISYFEKAYTLNSFVDKELLYYLGRAYHINSEWEKAIDNYQKFLNNLPADSEVNAEEIKKRITECNHGIYFTANPERVFIDNAGSVLNSQYPEYGAIISADESVLMFTSKRPETTGGEKDSYNNYFEDIYISYRVNKQWTIPVNIGEAINTKGHDATINLSPDGQKLMIYKDDNGDGNIYECELVGDVWSKPKKMSKSINSPYKESSASYSFDQKTIYFVSNRVENSLGGLDIFVSHWDEEKQRWKEASNLGSTINTKYDEEGVFMHPDGKTLYFSSKGHNSMGGYDIFKTTYENGNWTLPINLGYPINTPDDDVFFSISGSGRHGYYSSFNIDGYGEKDIYRITFLGPEKPMVLSSEDNLIASEISPIKEIAIEPRVEINKVRLTILKGIVRDKDAKQPLESVLEIIDNTTGLMVSTVASNSSTGKYLVSLPSGRNYGLAVKAEGYLFHSENINIPKEAAFAEVHKDIFMSKIKIGEKVILRNIFFDSGKYSLRTESSFELGRIHKLLTDNPSIKVEISGHTDDVGSEVTNQQLSENRAKAVVDFLIKQGIASARLIYPGYGEDQPVASNDTNEGRQENRRTEFKILEK